MGSLEGVFALVMLEMNEALGIYRCMEYQVGVVGVGPYSLVWMNLRVLVGLRALRVDQEHSKKEIGLFPMSKIEYVGTYRWMSLWLVSSNFWNWLKCRFSWREIHHWWRAIWSFYSKPCKNLNLLFKN